MPPTYIVLPITSGEAGMLQASGWESLERAFATQDPDLADPARPEMLLSA